MIATETKKTRTDPVSVLVELLSREAKNVPRTGPSSDFVKLPERLRCTIVYTNDQGDTITGQAFGFWEKPRALRVFPVHPVKIIPALPGETTITWTPRD